MLGVNWKPSRFNPRCIVLAALPTVLAPIDGLFDPLAFVLANLAAKFAAKLLSIQMSVGDTSPAHVQWPMTKGRRCPLSDHND